MGAWPRDVAFYFAHMSLARTQSHGWEVQSSSVPSRKRRVLVGGQAVRAEAAGPS